MQANGQAYDVRCVGGEKCLDGEECGNPGIKQAQKEDPITKEMECRTRNASGFSRERMLTQGPPPPLSSLARCVVRSGRYVKDQGPLLQYVMDQGPLMQYVMDQGPLKGPLQGPLQGPEISNKSREKEETRRSTLFQSSNIQGEVKKSRSLQYECNSEEK